MVERLCGTEIARRTKSPVRKAESFSHVTMSGRVVVGNGEMTAAGPERVVCGSGKGEA
jgi:hypothetical protein